MKSPINLSHSLSPTRPQGKHVNGWGELRWMRKAQGRVWMEETEQWLAHLEATGRKPNTIQTHRNNVRRCLQHLQWLRG